MWPYDYFNEYSALEIDFESERENKETNATKAKKVFVAMDFGDRNNKTREQQNAIFAKIKEAIEGRYKEQKVIIFTRTKLDEKLDRQGRRIVYRLEAKRSDDYKSGNILTNILQMIIQSALVICDITPNSDDLNFNENVMFELGLAMAWKMPEQVIVLCEENRFKQLGENNKLPFDLKHYNIEPIDGEYKNITKIVDNKINSFEQRKNIILNNVGSKLDKESLSLLGRRNGLMFAGEQIDSSTIRHLLNLNIIRTVVFPSNPITFGYSLTELGKRVLLELEKQHEGEFCKESEIQLYSDIIIDMYTVRYWAGYPSIFEEKKIEFRKIYELEWIDGLKGFIECMPRDYKEALNKKFKLEPENKEEDIYNLFSKYLENYPFDYVDTYTVETWEKRIGLKK